MIEQSVRLTPPQTASRFPVDLHLSRNRQHRQTEKNSSDYSTYDGIIELPQIGDGCPLEDSRIDSAQTVEPDGFRPVRRCRYGNDERRKEELNENNHFDGDRVPVIERIGQRHPTVDRR